MPYFVIRKMAFGQNVILIRLTKLRLPKNLLDMVIWALFLFMPISLNSHQKEMYFMEVLKSDNSSGFTLNWGTDTNSIDQLIEYNGKKFTYDALWQAADTGTVVDASGKNATLYDAVLVSNTLNADGSRSVVINYAAANIEGVVTTNIYDVELWWYQAPNGTGYDYKSIEFVDDGNGTLTMTIDAETASAWVGSISFDVIISVQTAGADASTNYVSLSSVFATAAAE
jgi:hypothetical protein